MPKNATSIGTALIGENGLVPGSVHHLPDLLFLNAEQILDRFLVTQKRDFSAVIADIEDPDSALRKRLTGLQTQAGPDSAFAQGVLFQRGALTRIFEELHDHVMAHPVWRHPFFVRFFEGTFTADQLAVFACHYFNQVKNTRQCVALATARFHGLADISLGRVSQPVSELTQVVLAQLLADEYGVATSGIDDYPTLGQVFGATTHTALYRRMLTAIGITGADQDVPMLPEVADNVLIQRLIAGDPAFSNLEALASVGLGMEWGVPEFFSLLLGGMIRYADRTGLPLCADDLEILSGHVRYDVLHAVSVMVATALHLRDDDDVKTVKNAVNMLMSGRYAMMSGLYRAVFDGPCPDVTEISLEARYRITDHRMCEVLIKARKTAAPEMVVGQGVWMSGDTVPLVFAR